MMFNNGLVNLKENVEVRNYLGIDEKFVSMCEARNYKTQVNFDTEVLTIYADDFSYIYKVPFSLIDDMCKKSGLLF